MQFILLFHFNKVDLIIRKELEMTPIKFTLSPCQVFLVGVVSLHFCCGLVFSTFNFNLSKPLSAWVFSFSVPIATRSIMATQSWILGDSSPMPPYICIHIQTCWKKNINLGLNLFLDFSELNSFSNYVEPNAYFDSMFNMHRSW
jgi:hypothetical protein